MTRSQGVQIDLKQALALFQGGYHGQDTGDILGPGASPFLLRSSPQQGLEGFRDFKEPHPHRSAELVGTGGHEIARSQARCRQLSDPLRGITGERNPRLAAQFQHLLPGLDHSRFVVGSHEHDRADIPAPQTFAHLIG